MAMVNRLKNTPELRTKRLVLRKFTWEDLQAFFDIHADEAVNVFLPWFPLRSVEEAKVFFEERYEDEYKKERAYRYAVCLQHNNIPVGYTNVSTDDGHDLGFGLRKEFWGKRIIIEAFEAAYSRPDPPGC